MYRGMKTKNFLKIYYLCCTYADNTGQLNIIYNR